VFEEAGWPRASTGLRVDTTAVSAGRLDGDAPRRHRRRDVTQTEAGDDGAAYGVEVRLPDGRQVEVNLDQSFKVVGQDPDDP
jgi:hypothetical protein